MKNIRKNVLCAMLLSTILSGCGKKEYYFNDILNKYSDETLVDDLLNEDIQTKNNIKRFEKDVDKYYKNEYCYLENKELEKEIAKYAIDSVNETLQYTLVGEVCKNLNLDINEDHSFDAKYMSILNDDKNLSMYVLNFDNYTLYVNDNSSLFDLIRYIAIINTYDLKKNPDMVKILNDALIISKEVIIKGTTINEKNEFYTKNNFKRLVK